MFNTTSTTSTPGRTSIARGNSGDDRAPDAHERRPAARLGGRAPCQQGEAQADRQAHGSRRLRTRARAAFRGAAACTAARLERERQRPAGALRSEEHTSELQSLMRISYAVFCLKKKKSNQNNINRHE